MTKNKRKYFIDDRKAIEIFTQAYGFKVIKMNFYQLRIYHEESPGFWDWYHTQGSTVRNEDGYCQSWGEFGDVEKLAIAINKYVYR